MSNLSTAISNQKNLENQRTAFSVKLESESAVSIELSKQHDEAAVRFNNIERAHILDRATDTELQAAQQHLDDIAAKLTTADRRQVLMREELKKLDTQIQQAAQDVRISRSQFCLNQRNAIFKEIQNDHKLKSKLLEAIAAHALNGHVSYTNHWQTFINQFAAQILPDATFNEVQTAIDKFQRNNGLN